MAGVAPQPYVFAAQHFSLSLSLSHSRASRHSAICIQWTYSSNLALALHLQSASGLIVCSILCVSSFILSFYHLLFFFIYTFYFCFSSSSSGYFQHWNPALESLFVTCSWRATSLESSPPAIRSNKLSSLVRLAENPPLSGRSLPIMDSDKLLSWYTLQLSCY